MNKARRAEGGLLTWHCPGCECGHGVPIQGQQAWGWNGSLQQPTLTPSVVVHAHDASPPFKPQPRCHCFVVEGKIQFLDDCTHALKGRTVEMEEA